VSQYDTMTQKSSKLLEKMQKIQKNCWLRKKIDVSHNDTLTRLCHQKSLNLMDLLKTAEGTGGAPTCLLYRRFSQKGRGYYFFSPKG
jgi:hypothetical protein